MDSTSLEAGKLVDAPVTAVIASAPDSPELGGKSQSMVHKEGRRAAVGSSDRTWQRRLLPLMVGLLVTLTAFFIVASFVQLYYLQTRIEKVPRLDLGPAMTSLDEIAKDMQSGKLPGSARPQQPDRAGALANNVHPGGQRAPASVPPRGSLC